jgi:dTDP-4-dehydrorhamnose reductase
MIIGVTGYKGMLGSVLTEKLTQAGHTVIGVDLPEHNLLAFSAIQKYFSENKIQFLYNCAAFTNVDKCETEYDTAYAVNALAVQNCAALGRKMHIPFVHISTDYVFTGTATVPYTTDTLPAPLSAYGRSKAAGENLVLATYPDKSFIVRTAWLYGHRGKNFVETILKNAATKPELQIVNDQTGAPTFVDDFVVLLLKLLDSSAYGIYNFTNAGVTTWYDFAREFLSLAKVSTSVVPCTTAEYTAQYPQSAKRPAYSVLDLSKTEQTFKIIIPTWQDAIRRYMKGRP